MKNFQGADFLLHNDTANELYRKHADKLPIIDFHCHLDPKRIAENTPFESITDAWLAGDHYKWRAMRANGVQEEFITGDKPPYEKFLKWSETLPFTMRNPLYHWTHMELSRIFGVYEILKPASARTIYDACNAKLQTPEFKPQEILKRMKVEVIATTDDPIDNLQYHRAIRKSDFTVKVFPTWRADKSINVENPAAYNNYIEQLETAANTTIHGFDDLIDALQKRHDYFKTAGCCVSDHGLDTFYATPYTQQQVQAIFHKVRSGQQPDIHEVNQFKSAMLYELAVMDAKADWVQQFHVGALRNNNSRLFQLLGPDVGCDGVGDQAFANEMCRFFDRLDQEGKLAKTIVYNLNPKDNDSIVSGLYNFNRDPIPGKMQFGAAWWLLDHIKGMQTQLDVLSAHGLLSRFVGMVTDSRSLLSYVRHEYFRRILCNVIGHDVEKGILPSEEIAHIGQIVQDVCYFNAKKYFGW